MLSRRTTLPCRGTMTTTVALTLLLISQTLSFIHHSPIRRPLSVPRMVLTRPSTENDTIVTSFTSTNDQKRRVRRKYKRKNIPDTEKELKTLRQERQAEYEQILSNADGASPSIWSFESLFPEPVWDEASVKKDLYGAKKQDEKTKKQQSINKKGDSSKDIDSANVLKDLFKMRSSLYGGNSMLRVWREPKLSSAYLPYDPPKPKSATATTTTTVPDEDMTDTFSASSSAPNEPNDKGVSGILVSTPTTDNNNTTAARIDRDLTRMVEDRIYGYRRSQTGDFQYDTSLMGDGAVQFREGVRLGNPLAVNSDRLNYLAKKELQHGRVEEARELYAQAVEIDPRDGRAYLGLSRCAQRRRDFKLAREWLKVGISNSVSVLSDPVSNEKIPDRGANPFLLQALGVLEEKMGRLSKAEALYIAAAKSRPSHAAAWVALAQLRTRKLRQSPSAGRVCFQSAERELKRAGKSPSSHVYTAWASLEHKVGDTRRARELFQLALQVDPKCSAAWLQLGVMEAACKNWDEAQACFESVLKFDQRNSRVLQAFALMETKRPNGNSRKAIDLFERALKVNPRDAGVLQPYALYVAELGDFDVARDLLRRGTQVNKRHAPVWQAWGVFEMRHSSPEVARSIFQQGIWSCAQLAGCQSGGFHCARLWQAWGVLEAREGDQAAARRCFSRALDADSRNVPAITAWAQMEEQRGNVKDARMIFERALKQFPAGSEEKMTIWRSYELMEQRIGDVVAAQQVYDRSMREAIAVTDESLDEDRVESDRRQQQERVPALDKVLKKSNEVEVVRWEGSRTSLGGEVWLNEKAIEGKVPFDMKKKSRKTNNREKN